MFSFIKQPITDYSILKKKLKRNYKKKIKNYFECNNIKNTFKKNNNYNQIYNFFINKKNIFFFYEDYDFVKITNSYKFFIFYIKKKKIYIKNNKKKNILFSETYNSN
jgi:hypothetical protein